MHEILVAIANKITRDKNRWIDAAALGMPCGEIPVGVLLREHFSLSWRRRAFHPEGATVTFIQAGRSRREVIDSFRPAIIQGWFYIWRFSQGLHKSLLLPWSMRL